MWLIVLYLLSSISFGLKTFTTPPAGKELVTYTLSVNQNDSAAPGTLLVSTLQGSLYALDAPTGELLWSYQDNTPLISSTLPQGLNWGFPSPSSDNVKDIQDRNFIIPGIDGSLYYPTQLGLQKFPISVPDMVAATPFKTREGLRFLGNKETEVYLLDKKSGMLHGVYSDRHGMRLNECPRKTSLRNYYGSLKPVLLYMLYHHLDEKNGIYPWARTPRFLTKRLLILQSSNIVPYLEFPWKGHYFV